MNFYVWVGGNPTSEFVSGELIGGRETQHGRLSKNGRPGEMVAAQDLGRIQAVLR